MDKSQKRENQIIFWTKCVLLVTGLFTAMPLVNHIGRDVYKIYCVWCFFCVIYLFFKRKKNYWKIEYLLLFLFCGFYALTIINGSKQHLVNEIAILGYTGILLFTMTYCDRERGKEAIKQELLILSRVFILVTFLFSVIGLYMFFFSHSGEFVYQNENYIYGMYENRLWGLYNPNTGSSINYISVFLSFLLIKELKHGKFFFLGNVIVQSLCFILAQSRGAWICVLVYTVFYMLFVKKYKYVSKENWKNWGYKIVLTTILCVTMVGGGELLKVSMAKIPSMIVKMQTTENQTIGKAEDSSDIEASVKQEQEIKEDNIEVKQELAESEAESGLKRLDKKEKNLQSISTGRTSIWKIGLKAYTEHPILGIGYRSIDDTLLKQMDEWGYNNSAAGGLHNVYITVLVAAGTVGFLLFSLYLLLVLTNILKCLFVFEFPQYVKALAIFVPAILVGELAESRIIFGMNWLAIFFWILVGYIGYFAEKGKKKDDQHHCTGI